MIAPPRLLRCRLLATFAILALAAPALAETSPTHLERLLELARTEYDLPAVAAAVIVDGHTIEATAVGVRKHGADVRVRPGDQFHLGSCTKAMTATLVALLVERGRMRWEATLAETFPDLKMRPEYRAVTLRALAAHRGGFPHTTPEGKTLIDLHALGGKTIVRRRRYVQLLLETPPAVAPGTEFLYSNAGISILGAAAEVATGKTWESLMRTHLFGPLKQTSAGFGAMGRPGKIEQPWQHRLGARDRLIPVEPGPRSDNPVVMAPAGLVHMSILDWAHFVETQLGSRKLFKDDATRVQLHTPVKGESYAGGWSVAARQWSKGPVLAHSGSNTINYCVAWLAPREKFAVLIATNRAGDPASLACDRIAATVIRVYAVKR